MTKDEALKLAIEALKDANYVVFQEWSINGEYDEAIKACKEALEDPLTRDWKNTIDERIARDSEFKEALEQPTDNEQYKAFIDEVKYGQSFMVDGKHLQIESVYEQPITQESRGCLACVTCGELVTEWQGLSDDEIATIIDAELRDWEGSEAKYYGDVYAHIAHAIEAKLKEKNTWIYN